MTKRKRSRGNRARKCEGNPLGTAFDKVDGKPQVSRILFTAGSVVSMLEARLTFDKALAEIAAEERFGGPSNTATELETLEESTRLVMEARRDLLHSSRKYDQHDVVNAAATYIEMCLEDGRLTPLGYLLSSTQPEITGQTRFRFAVAVAELVGLYVQGSRLTPHRSGDAYEKVRERFLALFGKSVL